MERVPYPWAYADISDSRLTGAALYFRLFLVRFAKRFPPQHDFVNPHVDSDATRRELIEEIGDGFQAWSFMKATVDHPAAIVVRMDNKGLKAMNAVSKPASWRAVNHFYEFAITEPSRELSGHPSIFIIDLGKVSMSKYNKTNISDAAGQLVAAMYHPEPFSAFVVAHAPTLFQMAWGIAKYFLTESAREKFIILNGSASSHFVKNLGVPLEKLPSAVGGKSETQLLSVAELLEQKTQMRAADAHFAAAAAAAGAGGGGRGSGGGGSGGGAGGHRPDGGGGGVGLRRVGDSAGLDDPGSPSTSGGGVSVGGGGGGGGGRRDSFGRSNTMNAVVDLQGKINDLESKLDRAMSPRKVAGSGVDGGEGVDNGTMRTMMMAQTGVMLLLILVIAALVFVLIKNDGGIGKLF